MRALQKISAWLVPNSTEEMNAMYACLVEQMMHGSVAKTSLRPGQGQMSRL